MKDMKGEFQGMDWDIYLIPHQHKIVTGQATYV
jgi:hypothetical protein